MKENKLIASIVVFKELHDNNKDIYDIISEFIKAGIIHQKKWVFNATEITLLLENIFDFKLPEAVIKTTLKKRLIKSKFLTFEDGSYNVTNIEAKIDPHFESNYENKKSLYKKTEEEFVKYVEDEKEKSLSKTEINEIRKNLNQFLLGNGVNEKYTQEISSYIIKNKDNKEFKERLNVVKEGLVLYTGIRYTADINELGKWNNELTIFLDTEILFYFFGYNGEVYKEIFNDFYKLIREINTNSEKKKIKLKYFEETEQEIYNFFHVASLIIDNKTSLNPSKTAMKEIVNGCVTKSDIIVKRNNFFITLKTAGILKEDEIDYYKDYSHNIEGTEILKELKQMSADKKREFNEEGCLNHLKLFTKINTLRKGVNNQGFDKSKYIILTGNRFIHYLAHNKHIKDNEKDIPFATDIDYITDKFWFKLKKGFGESDDVPKSFDIVTKAQIVLSTQISNTVQEKYTALNERYKAGKITKEEAISLNYELRESTLKPEDITEVTITDSLYFINNFSIEDHIREQTILKQKVAEGEIAKLEIKRRDLKERTKIIKPKKIKYRIIASFYYFLLFSLLFVTFYFAYKLLIFIIEPSDSKLSIIGFVIGVILALIPLYKFRKQIKSFITKKIKLNFKKTIEKQ
ncbi:MAG: hypothetical protein COA67_02095 [Lutibacter sp.]|nr:MAG: hypothetical protein COA67_02095 [Lutibacter sp.]